MTDLIASIVALINASPRSPTKEEIEDLVEPWFRSTADGICCGDYDNCTRACYHRGFQAGQKSQKNTPLMPLPYKDVTASLMPLMEKTRADMRSVTGVDNLPRADCQAEAPSVSKAMLDAKDAIRKSAYEDDAIRLERAKTLLRLGDAAALEAEGNRAAQANKDLAERASFEYRIASAIGQKLYGDPADDEPSCPRCGTTDYASIIFCDLHCKPAPRKP